MATLSPHSNDAHAITESYSRADQAERQHDMDEQKKFHEMLKNMMHSMAQRRTNFTAMCHVMLGFLTAPLMTLSMSLQVSLPKNRLTFEDFKP